MRNARLVSMVAETHVHVGEGQAFAEVDLPIAREKVTGLPFVPGHGHKGALRATMKEQLEEALWREIFGREDASEGAGALIVADIRLVALPVRSRGRVFVLATSTYLLARLARDLRKVGRSADALEIETLCRAVVPLPSSGDALLPEGVDLLEDFVFSPVEKLVAPSGGPGAPTDGERSLREAIAAAMTRVLALPDHLELSDRLAVLRDDDFQHLARVAPPVRTRNILNEDKVSKNIWQEETLPPDTVMTAILANRTTVRIDDSERVPVDIVLDKLVSPNDGGRFLQIGGNETVGEGWFEVFDTIPRLETSA